MLKPSAMRSRGVLATGPRDGTRIATADRATDLSSPADLLIARVAHELRQPLASILAATAVIGRHINRSAGGAGARRTARRDRGTAKCRPNYGSEFIVTLPATATAPTLTAGR